jgi:ABC-2 type transport system ATP-binding protein
VPAVEVHDLTVRYGTLEAVAGVSFAAESGRVTAVLGPNGAGKTSTIEVCEGYRRPASGTVRVLGLDPATDQQTLAARMGVMLQDGGVYPSARVGDMARLYCDLYGKGVDSRDLVERVGLTDRTGTAWRRLSGGEKQRLSLALALAARPEVAVLDEPTSGVDVGGRATIRRILADLAASGCAVVLATHELDEVERVADHVVVFDRGRVVADGTLDALRGARRELRVRVRGTLDAGELARVAAAPVREVAAGEYVVDDPGPSALAAVSAWLESEGTDVIGLRSGAASLEDVFLRLTGDSDT